MDKIEALCDDDCEYLVPNEKDQNEMGDVLPHICTLYHIQVKHKGKHPNIIKCSLCKMYGKFKKKENTNENI